MTHNINNSFTIKPIIYLQKFKFNAWSPFLGFNSGLYLCCAVLYVCIHTSVWVFNFWFWILLSGPARNYQWIHSHSSRWLWEIDHLDQLRDLFNTNKRNRQKQNNPSHILLIVSVLSVSHWNYLDRLSKLISEWSEDIIFFV